MNTADLVARVATEQNVSKDHVRKIVDAVLAAITAAAIAQEEVTLTSFGRFKATARPARQGRNPGTGEAIEIAASRKLTFTPAKNVRDALNRSEKHAP
jgi:DNA-binding protein HU-beta